MTMCIYRSAHNTVKSNYNGMVYTNSTPPFLHIGGGMGGGCQGAMAPLEIWEEGPTYTLVPLEFWPNFD